MKLEVQITKTATFEKVLNSQVAAIKRLADALGCLAQRDLPGTQVAIQDAMTGLGKSLRVVAEDREEEAARG